MQDFLNRIGTEEKVCVRAGEKKERICGVLLCISKHDTCMSPMVFSKYVRYYRLLTGRKATVPAYYYCRHRILSINNKDSADTVIMA